MSAFHEVQFPPSISVGSTGGPEWRTEIAAMDNGFEERNSPWSQARRRYDASLGIRNLAEIVTVVEFFNARRGRLYGFRWKDWLDFKSCLATEAPSALDQTLGLGDGTRREFQLVKRALSGGALYRREIRKPVSGTVLVAVDGVAAPFALDPATGIVTLAAAPSAGAQVTAGFEFDVPVRFDTDSLMAQADMAHLASIPSIPILEIRL